VGFLPDHHALYTQRYCPRGLSNYSSAAPGNYPCRSRPHTPPYPPVSLFIIFYHYPLAPSRDGGWRRGESVGGRCRGWRGRGGGPEWGGGWGEAGAGCPDAPSRPFARGGTATPLTYGGVGGGPRGAERGVVGGGVGGGSHGGAGAGGPGGRVRVARWGCVGGGVGRGRRWAGGGVGWGGSSGSRGEGRAWGGEGRGWPGGASRGGGGGVSEKKRKKTRTTLPPHLSLARPPTRGGGRVWGRGGGGCRGRVGLAAEAIQVAAATQPRGASQNHNSNRDRTCEHTHHRPVYCYKRIRARPPPPPPTPPLPKAREAARGAGGDAKYVSGTVPEGEGSGTPGGSWHLFVSTTFAALHMT